MSFYDTYETCNPKDIDIDITKIYHIAFFNGDRLDTRPIKLTRLFKMRNSDEVVAHWTYFFESEKTFLGKLTDKRLWNKVFSRKEPIIKKRITEGFKVDFNEDIDMLKLELVGINSNNSKLKLCMYGSAAKEASNDKLQIINNELDYFREEEPDLLLKAMDWFFPAFDGDIIDYSDKFINIKDDIRNT